MPYNFWPHAFRTVRADGPPAGGISDVGAPDAHGAFDVVVIAASLGGREALTRVLAPLPADFPAPIVVAQHLRADAPGYLPTLLARSTALAVRRAADGDRLEGGTVYVAPPGRHLLIDEGGRCTLSDGPRVSHARPSADLLFTSAAQAFGARTLAAVLTGRLFDGAAGAEAVRCAGGVVLVQEPATCVAPDMPCATLARGAAQFTLPPAALASALISLVAVRGGAALFGVSARTTA